ncbi:DUF2508 family protein [Caldalkalibacillus mannanilyticus]|uniref:DUF2508 family protein n=1 Tax=Caldalkalibacillus mannanilyticus TaxID=1418 RepID=UPI0004692466|nr:DUF2508 family protein [Caldalkalibacillus mannanilyticus]
MFWNKRNVRVNEEYNLVQSIEKARKKWSEVQAWRISEKEALTSQMPKILAELQYRFLLREARKRNMINRWFYNDPDVEEG